MSGLRKDRTSDAINISQKVIVLSRKMIIIDEMRQFRGDLRAEEGEVRPEFSGAHGADVDAPHATVPKDPCQDSRAPIRICFARRPQ